MNEFEECDLGTRSSVALKILVETLKNHPEIEGNAWVNAYMQLIALAYKRSDFSYKIFKKNMRSGIKSYKKLWDEE